MDNVWSDVSDVGLALKYAIIYRIVPLTILALVVFGIWSVAEFVVVRLSNAKKSDEKEASKGRDAQEVRLAALGFCSVGAVVGVIVGASKTPLGETALTGFIGLVSAFSAYAFAKESLDRYRKFAAPILFTLSLSLASGVYFAAAFRQGDEARAASDAADDALETRLSEARTAVCRDSAIATAELGADPITMMGKVCREQLGFFENPE